MLGEPATKALQFAVDDLGGVGARVAELLQHAQHGLDAAFDSLQANVNVLHVFGRGVLDQ